MENILRFILENIVANPDDIDIQQENEEDIIRFNLTLHDEDYPKVIGKRGLTIKAITDILRLYDSKHNPDSFSRIYINAATQQTDSV